MRSVTRSRVVPGVAVTMARSRSTSRLKSELLPALGRPTMASVRPSWTTRPRAKEALERGERRRKLVDAAGDLLLRSDVDVVFGEVDAGLKERDQFDEGLFERLHATAERAAHLAGGLAGLGERLRVDEVADSFSLGEVELAGKKGALRELAGLGEARAQSESAAEEQIEDDGRAVRGDLNQVFCGVGVRRGEEGDDGFVDALAGSPRRRGHRRGVRGHAPADGGGATSCAAIAAASGPLSRTMPMPPRPGGVEMAAMVSMAASMAALRPRTTLPWPGCVACHGLCANDFYKDNAPKQCSREYNAR